MADPCELDLKLSTGKKFEFYFRDDERFFLVKMESRVYAVANSNRPGKRSIVAVTKEGMVRVCNGL